MIFYRQNLSDTELLDLYKKILKPRLIEEKMLILIRQGKVSKWFSGIGQEAIAVGVTAVLDQSEYILPMHRNLGVFTTREVPLHRLFSQWQGKANGFTKGRDRSFHFGTQEYNIIGMISHLGPQLGIADGIALANKLQDNKKITAVFTGEGGTSEGDFHEALNIAAVWKLPVMFIVENHQLTNNMLAKTLLIKELVTELKAGLLTEIILLKSTINCLNLKKKCRKIRVQFCWSLRLLECVDTKRQAAQNMFLKT